MRKRLTYPLGYDSLAPSKGNSARNQPTKDQQMKVGRKPYVLTKANIFERTKREGDCIVWTGSRSVGGYGQCGDGIRGVHRFAYQIFKGPIPRGKQVCHSCDNPPCINPNHLFLGTARDNTDDKLKKGRKNASRHILTNQQVLMVRALSKTTSFLDLAAQFKVHWRTIHNIVKKKTRANLKSA